MITVLLTLAIFLAIVLAMSVGVIFKRPCLRGSCGGPSVVGRDGKPLSCATCPNRDKNRRREAEASTADGLPVVR